MIRRISLIALAACAILALGCQGKEEGSTATPEAEGTVKKQSSGDAKLAIAKIESKSGSKVTGEATFTEEDGKVVLTVNIEGAEPGTHGIHLHEEGDCSAEDASSAGGHWNPTAEDHGMMAETDAAHSGDMGNIEVGADGKGTLRFVDEGGRWSIGGDDKTNVVGRSIVVHAKADDLKTQPTGDSGDRIGCGVIEQG